MHRLIASFSRIAVASLIGITALLAVVRCARAEKSVRERVAEYGDSVKKRLSPDFERAHVKYPPARLAILGFKKEKRLELYAADKNGKWKFVRSYPILAASGTAGPKLREGDSQVPEGIYRIESLNPNSAFHLSLRVNYPNAADRAHAAAEGRTTLGGDIMIHGKAASIGCLAMGDEAAEDLFVIAAQTGIKNIEVILSPIDFRAGEMEPPKSPAWMADLYQKIKSALAAFPKSS